MSCFQPPQDEEDEYEDHDYYDDEEDPESIYTDQLITPDMFDGEGGQQAMEYMQKMLNRARKRQLSAQRGRGMPPSSVHNAPPPKKTKTMDQSDPSYVPPEQPVVRNKGRGKTSQARGRGRGRGARGGRNDSSTSTTAQVSMQQASYSTSEHSDSIDDGDPVKGQHWRPNELSALIKGANHLKPVLKGKFRHATDGVVLKELAWNELVGKATNNMYKKPCPFV